MRRMLLAAGFAVLLSFTITPVGAQNCVSCVVACKTCGYSKNGCEKRCKAKGNPNVVADCSPGVKVFKRCQAPGK